LILKVGVVGDYHFSGSEASVAVDLHRSEWNVSCSYLCRIKKMVYGVWTGRFVRVLYGGTDAKGVIDSVNHAFNQH
jgi:hypothetical protein